MEEQKEVKFHEELAKMEYEPLNSTELKLVRYSILIGIVMLVIFYFTGETLFPGAHG